MEWWQLLGIYLLGLLIGSLVVGLLDFGDDPGWYLFAILWPLALPVLILYVLATLSNDLGYVIRKLVRGK